ncbi:MAG: ABC transporter ATP-binding protein [Acidimicrobiia bacterium]
MGLAEERAHQSDVTGETPVETEKVAPLLIAGLNGVTKTFRDSNAVINALDDITLDIYENEFIVLVGPSGSGKTTLLNILAGLIQPSTGRVRRRSEIGRPGGIGMVFQNATLLPWRNVLQNVLLPAEIFGMSKAEAEAEARDLLELVGLTGFEDSLPHQLSGGMQQRVSLCRALLSDPPLLLMDEPFGALDAISRETMNFELQRIWMEEKTTVVFVTHSIDEALFLSDRVVALTARPGKVAGTLDNDLPRPRNVHTLELPLFTEYGARLREMMATGAGE